MNTMIERYYEIREYIDNRVEQDIVGDEEQFELISQEYADLCNALLYDIMMNNKDVLTRLKLR